VLEAFVEVDSALLTRRTARQRRDSLADRVAALSEALSLARLRYDAGSPSYPEMLDAQRSLFRILWADSNEAIAEQDEENNITWQRVP
jgi:outer membrane protein, multidrug efflux system